MAEILDEVPTTKKVKRLAPIFNRILAFILDVAVYFFLGWVIAFFLGTTGRGLSFELEGFASFVYFIAGVLLWPISEGFTGQTIGKRVLKIKVVSDMDEPVMVGQVFIRYLVGIVDMVFCIGILIAILSAENKRLGDLVARTVVVQKKYLEKVNKTD